MRFLILVLGLVVLVSSPAFGITDAGYDAFIKSREVVETLYFNSNSETLSDGEQSRLETVITQLKELQKSGRIIRVEGFSSPDGDQERNFKLSFYRAKTVADLIQSGGLSEEVTLAGFGDLRADSKDFVKERRVEIASYKKPATMRRVKVAKNENNFFPEVNQPYFPEAEQLLMELENSALDIDSYHVDQAIRNKIDERNRGLANDPFENQGVPDLSRQGEGFEGDLERGYTLWRKSVDPSYSPKFTQVIRTDFNLRRGYSQSKPAAEELQRGYSQSKPATEELQRGYSQSKPATEELQRGYSQSKPATEELQRGYSQSKPATEELQRGYSQAIPAADDNQELGFSKWQKEAVDIPADAPELSQVGPVGPPPIDALMIEQAIMEKLGIGALPSAGAVTQVGMEFQSDNSSN